MAADTETPTRSWSREVMLQQTQVERVIPRYLALARALADCRVARGSAARRRDPRMAGARLQPSRRQPPSCGRRSSATGWPRDLTSLPGVGTTRLRRCGTSPRRARAAGRRQRLARAGANRPRLLTRRAQALMDLGATVCLARVPRCGVCPLAGGCPSRGHATSRRASRAVRGLVPPAALAGVAAGRGAPRPAEELDPQVVESLLRATASSSATAALRLPV